MYNYEASEILMYAEILCQHHNIDIKKDIRQLTRLFNEVLELPIDYIELQEIIFSPAKYEEKRLILCQI